MLIDKYGNVDYRVKGAITKGGNIILSENQFLQWTSSGKRLELWQGKQECLQDEDIDCDIQRLKYWNENSIYGFIN